MGMKMRHPKPTSGFSHAGKSYKPDKNGVLDIPGFAVDVAISHGFRPVDGEPDLTLAQKAAPLGPKIVDLADGKFDVLNDQGKKVNERPLDKTDADKTLAELQPKS